jgi:cell division protein FtsI/penicillin-binding protein 2
MDKWNNINSKVKIFKVISMIVAIALISKLAIVGIYNHDGFEELAQYQTTIETYAELPRGEIYDTNNNLVVGSVNNKSLMYVESDQMSNSEKMEVAQKIASLIELDAEDMVLNDTELTDLILSEDEYMKQVKASFTPEEKTEVTKMSDQEYSEFLRTKVTEEMKQEYINKYGLEAVAIRTKMLGATSKNPVVIKPVLTTEEVYALESNFGSIGGFYVTDDWVRTYPYGDTMSSFLGETGSIPEEEQNIYESQGYNANEEVGISYLEKELEPILHSKPAVVTFNFDENGNIVNTEIAEEGVPGSDVVLTIDMEIQQKTDAEVKSYLQQNNYVYNDSAYAVIQDPATGDILAMSGIKEIDGEYYDNSIGVFTEAYTMGSILKPAVLLMAYGEEALVWGQVINDAPMIVPGTPVKASYTNFGPINEMQAIAYSSNVYFYQAMLLIAGETYVENQPLDIEQADFDLARSYFEQFGLGTTTGINMENETTGFRGSNTTPGLYMDLGNGQYDTYTTLQTSQYVSTIANGGTRYKTEYIKSINSPLPTSEVGPVLYEQKSTVLNELTMDQDDIEHVQDAMDGCDELAGPAACKGKGFERTGTTMSGKSGTSETFYYDPATQTTYNTYGSSMIGYFPADNPEYSISVHVPNFTNNKNTGSVTSALNLGSNIMASIYAK